MQEVNVSTHINFEESIDQKFNQFQFESSILRNAIKCGVYKELYKKEMLTSQQLNELLTYANDSIAIKKSYE